MYLYISTKLYVQLLYWEEKHKIKNHSLILLVIIVLSTEDLCVVFSKLLFLFHKSLKDITEHKEQKLFKSKAKPTHFITSQTSITLKIVHYGLLAKMEA